ncbi:MAG: hypothetical protein ABIU63_16855 [Chitinophagaceae bacterium]
MWESEQYYSIRLGGNFYENVVNLLVYRGQLIFTITRAENSGSLGIDFDIYDNAGSKIAVVKNSRIYSGNNKDFAIVVDADRWSLSEKNNGRLICDIRKRSLVSTAELEVNVKLYMPNGYLFEATPEGTNLPQGNIFSNNHFKNSQVGIMIN